MLNRFITLAADILFNLGRKILLHNKELKANRALNPASVVALLACRVHGKHKFHLNFKFNNAGGF